MSRQSFIGCVDKPQQLRAVAFEAETASHEVQFAPVTRARALAKRIDFNVCNVVTILCSHKHLYSGANDNVAFTYFERLRHE